MYTAEEVHSAWHIIGRNKTRSFLTMLGIIIGVMSVIIVISVGAGAQSLILNQIKSMGTDLIGVLPGKSEEKGPPASVFGIIVTSLKDSDGEAILNSDYAHIIAFSSYVKGVDTVTHRENNLDTTFVGVKAALPEVENAAVASGRFFTDDEESGLAKVAVLGSQTASDLFPNNDEPIGQLIKIKKINFLVIGIMKARGTSGFQNQDNQIFVPLKTAQKLLLGIDHVSFMRLKVDSAEKVAESMEAVKEILRSRHRVASPEEDDFSVRSMAQGLGALTAITDALRIFLASVAAISLLVGGIGIMNIMLAAVQERTREIGLRKAVGATDRRIRRQFLVEASLITFIAGLIGIVFGVIISIAVAMVARKMGYEWDFSISPVSILMGCAVSVGIGLLFGLAPARRASRLDPIVALRYE